MDLWDEFDRLFGAFSSGRAVHPFRRGGDGAAEQPSGILAGLGAAISALHVVERENEVVIQAELPGMDDDDIEIIQSGGTLTICGEKEDVREDGEGDSPYYIVERRHSSFQRSIRIPDGVDPRRIGARFSDGILTITLPKAPETDA